MLNTKQIEIIKKYVPEKYFSHEKLIKYLTLHDMVGVEVFDYCAKRVYKDKSSSRSFETVVPIMFRSDWNIDIKPGEEDRYIDRIEFVPEDIETFLRRAPFNFYHKRQDIEEDLDNEEAVWCPVSINDLLYSLGASPFSDMYYHRKSPLSLEEAYEILEYLFYEKGYTLESIFNYTSSYSWVLESDLYADWFDYISMCRKLGWDDLMPKEFYYKYNLAREALGIDPIVFPIKEYDYEAWTRDREQVQFYKRKGNKLEFYGLFPCDEENKPVLRWIAVDIKNAESVICTERKGLECYITVTLTPKTVIHAQITERDEIGNELPDVEPKWVQVYAGPQTMSFNYHILKERRKALGYTQQEVADAVQANIRTYQKWESGDTKPDGYYLLRILNWLDIQKLTDVIIYEN